MSEASANGGTSAAPLFSEMAGDEDMRELVEFFVEELQDRIQSLESAFGSNDADQLKTLAHQLKGAAGGYGFPSISECAATLESGVSGASGDISGLKAEVDALVNLCRRAKV